MSMAKARREETKVIGIRLTASELRRYDAEAAERSRATETPVARADVIRSLIKRGWDSLVKERAER